MTTPVTALDQRYSDPAAAAAGWEETRRVLEAAELFWISTVRADGRPHVTPLVAAWAGGAIHFHTGEGEQKLLNLRANPHVVLTTGCNRWDRGLTSSSRARRSRSPTRRRSAGWPRPGPPSGTGAGSSRPATAASAAPAWTATQPGVHGHADQDLRARQGRPVRRHHPPVLTAGTVRAVTTTRKQPRVTGPVSDGWQFGGTSGRREQTSGTSSPAHSAAILTAASK